MGEENRATARERCFRVDLGGLSPEKLSGGTVRPLPQAPWQDGGAIETSPAIHTATLRGVCQGLSLPPLL